MIKMTNEINDENIQKIKDNSEICDISCCDDNCKDCVQKYLKTLLNKID